LVEFDNQFSEAIENAYLLYQYGLEKGYIVVQQQVNFFSSATSDSSKNNKESTTPNSPHVSAKNS
jgi:hypothetical protein